MAQDNFTVNKFMWEKSKLKIALNVLNKGTQFYIFIRLTTIKCMLRHRRSNLLPGPFTLVWTLLEVYRM